jgi:hypothetical protein
VINKIPSTEKPGKRPVVNIDDARDLRARGLPLNTPVKHREWTAAASRIIDDAHAAKVAFFETLIKFSETQSDRYFHRLRRLLDAITAVGNRTRNFVSPDQLEAELMHDFRDVLAGFVSRWQHTLDAVEDGEVVQFTLTREVLERW